MKKLLLLIATLSAFSSKAQTSVYQPLPDISDSNATWIEYVYGGVPPDVFYDNYSLFISGDTVLGNYSYHKLYKSGQSSSGGYLNSYSHFYCGSYRQDSLQKTVFFVPDTSSNEQLLYNFNLNVGDTLPLSYNNGNQGPFNKVIGIDSVMVGCIYHKIFYLASLYGGSTQVDSGYAIIEGVGSTLGLFQPIMPCLEACSRLNYFSYNEKAYPTNCGVSINEFEKMNFDFNFYPNPTTTTLTIQTPQKAALEITNIEGQTIKTFNITDKETTIDVSVLSGGVYIIKVQSDKGVVVRKFIKE